MGNCPEQTQLFSHNRVLSNQKANMERGNQLRVTMLITSSSSCSQALLETAYTLPTSPSSVVFEQTILSPTHTVLHNHLSALNRLHLKQLHHQEARVDQKTTVKCTLRTQYIMIAIVMPRAHIPHLAT